MGRTIRRGGRGGTFRAGDGDPPDNDAQRRLWQDAQDALLEARTVGDTVVAAFFTGKNDKERGHWLAARHSELTRWLAKESDGRGVREAVRGAMERAGVVAFHWELEFPEVFAGESGGFDAFVGNPPFAGKNNILQGNAEGYLDWLKEVHEESHGNADLVAHFFRRAFSMLRAGGTMGLIATNTLAQGDTRATGLRWICTHGGTIYDATRRYKWPGLAAVVVVAVHIAKGSWSGPRLLDGREVREITAFLFHRGGSENPMVLAKNGSIGFQGCNVLGKGFTFDDQEKKRDAVNSLAEMRALIAKDPRNGERIFPYLGGEELNNDPALRGHRYVINFGELSEEQARAWPDLMTIVEAKVKPERTTNNRDAYRK